MNRSRTINVLSALLLVLTSQGCKSAATVSKDELMELTRHWQEPKVAIWYYMGTKDDFDYFAYYDIGFNGAKYYKIQSGELNMEDPFPLTSDKKTWRVMPWGPYAHRKGNG